ncbi:MAG TPA: hypothetical protein VEB60_02880 [Candidatus Paceibacterota bacterium]|nr:hypothetical protein [Candidatus Paceibacterota bacterium]
MNKNILIGVGAVLALLLGGLGYFNYTDKASVSEVGSALLSQEGASTTTQTALTDAKQRKQSVKDQKADNLLVHTLNSAYVYKGEQYRVLASIKNPHVGDQSVVIAVKNLFQINTCGGLYDYGPCEFFVETISAGGEISVRHLGTLDMKPASFNNARFFDAKTIELAASVGDAGASYASIWRIDLDQWAPVRISEKTNG